MNHDEKLILDYLEQFDGQFISSVEIAKRADSRQRFITQPNWARRFFTALSNKGSWKRTTTNVIVSNQSPPGLCALGLPANARKSHLYVVGPKVMHPEPLISR